MRYSAFHTKADRAIQMVGPLLHVSLGRVQHDTTQLGQAHAQLVVLKYVLYVDT